MKLNKFAYLYSKPLGNHTLKIMKKYLEIYFKKLEKSWKYHGILSVRKSGNPELAQLQFYSRDNVNMILGLDLEFYNFDNILGNQQVISRILIKLKS